MASSSNNKWNQMAADGSKGKLNLPCPICGDRVVGINFDGLSCSSCRVFFQRYASKVATLQCINNGTCPLNWANRRSCSKCRMDKCLANGMNIEKAIHSKKRMTLIKRAAAAANGAARAAAVPSAAVANVSSESDTADNVDNAACSTATQPIGTAEEAKLALLQTYPANLRKPLATCSFTFVCSCLTCKQMRLNEFETVNIAKIIKLSRLFVDEMSLPLAATTADLSNLTNILNCMANYVNLMIKYCKDFGPFNELSVGEQSQLFKPFFIEFVVVRAAYHMSPDKPQFRLIANEEASEAVLIKIAQIGGPIKLEAIYKNTEICMQIRPTFDGDLMLRDLFSSMLLFRPRQKYQQTEFMRSNFAFSCRLLLRYLEFKYTQKKDAYEKYGQLMHLMRLLDNLVTDMSTVYTQLDGEPFAEVMLEILELADKVNKKEGDF